MFKSHVIINSLSLDAIDIYFCLLVCVAKCGWNIFRLKMFHFTRSPVMLNIFSFESSHFNLQKHLQKTCIDIVRHYTVFTIFPCWSLAITDFAHGQFRLLDLLKDCWQTLSSEFQFYIKKRIIPCIYLLAEWSIRSWEQSWGQGPGNRGCPQR